MDLEFHQLDRRFEDLRLQRPDRERSLLGSLAETGQQIPIVVVAHDDTYVVIDGFQRLRCLERLGADTVRATLWDLSPEEALLLDRSQRSSQGLCPLEQGWLLLELRNQGWSLEDLARRVGKSVSWVSRHLALVSELPAEVQEQVRCGALPAHAAMRHLVPIARHSPEDCLRLAAASVKAQLSSREIDELCAAFLNSSAQVRERLLEDPRLFLRARAAKQAPKPRPAHVEMLGDLDRMAHTARRLAQRLQDAETTPQQRSELRLALAQVRAQLDAFEEEIQRVGREDPQRDSDTGAQEDLATQDRQAAEHLTQQRARRTRLAQQPAEDPQPSHESRSTPRPDPGASPEVPGQSRPRARGTRGRGGGDRLPDPDRLLPPPRDRNQAQEAGRQVRLRAGPGDAA